LDNNDRPIGSASKKACKIEPRDKPIQFLWRGSSSRLRLAQAVLTVAFLQAI
jgi:hypothetical protein